MDVKTIKKYIKDNSTASSRSNSYYVDPKLVSQSNSHFEFTYDGNSSYDYQILIDFRNGIETSCNCPYKNNYPGICKHVIASLNTIIVNYADQIVNAIAFFATFENNKSQNSTVINYCANFLDF